MPYKDPEVQKRFQAANSKKRREFINSLKDNKPCADCGVAYPYYIMQFDHVGTDKSANISKIKSRRMTYIMAEIAKCELVCANCHAERSQKRILGRVV